MTMFQPQTYSSIEELKKASIMEAHSDTTIDGRDVFGYVDGVAFFADYVWDDISEATYAVAAID